MCLSKLSLQSEGIETLFLKAIRDSEICMNILILSFLEHRGSLSLPMVDEIQTLVREEDFVLHPHNLGRYIGQYFFLEGKCVSGSCRNYPVKVESSFFDYQAGRLVKNFFCMLNNCRLLGQGLRNTRTLFGRLGYGQY